MNPKPASLNTLRAQMLPANGRHNPKLSREAPAPVVRGRLELKAPNRLMWWAETADGSDDGDGATIIGASVYLLLEALLAARNWRLPIPNVCEAVWDSHKVKEETVWSLTHRANLKLKEANCPLRVAQEMGDIILI